MEDVMWNWIEHVWLALGFLGTEGLMARAALCAEDRKILARQYAAARIQRRR
jgi:hypothetical protein